MKEEWSEEVRHSSEAIQISLSSTTICCSMRGTTVKALHDPSTEACTMSEFLTDTFVGNMLLVPTDKLLKSPSGLIFECRGIARAVPIKIDKIRVHLDFHIYPILNFDLLIGYPLDKLHLDKSSQGSLDKIFRNSTFTTACLENPIAKPLSKKNPLEKVMCVSPFVSSEPILFKGVPLHPQRRWLGRTSPL
ncbi:hypothetical protein SEVIR_2G205001v4 [Setaria viridis]